MNLSIAVGEIFVRDEKKTFEGWINSSCWPAFFEAILISFLSSIEMPLLEITNRNALLRKK
jgi:hypothetical protein